MKKVIFSFFVLMNYVPVHAAPGDLKPGPAIYAPDENTFKVCQILSINGVNANVVINDGSGHESYTLIPCSKLRQSKQINLNEGQG